MNLGHLSDLHFDAQRQIAGALRTDAQGRNVALVNAGRCLRSVAKQIARLSGGVPDLWLVTGDVFDRAQPSATEEAEAIRCMVDLARAAPVVIIAGNHDIPGAAGAATALECLKRRPRIHVIEEPCVLRFVRSLRNGGAGGLDRDDTATSPALAIACVPYPRRAEFATSEAMAGTTTSDERNAIASQLLAQLVTGLRAQCAGFGAAVPKALVYHGSIAGAMTRFQPRDLRGDIGLTRAAFDGWDYVGVGHIHQQQEIPGTDGRVWYAGSVDRCDFGEEGEPKGGLHVALGAGGDGGALCVTPCPSPAQEYVTLSPDAFLASVPSDHQMGTAYRIKGTVTPDGARDLRRIIADCQAHGMWLADALTVESEVRLRDANASAEEAPADFLRRWLAGREGLGDTASRVGMTREAFAEAVVARHREA